MPISLFSGLSGLQTKPQEEDLAADPLAGQYAALARSTLFAFLAGPLGRLPASPPSFNSVIIATSRVWLPEDVANMAERSECRARNLSSQGFIGRSFGPSRSQRGRREHLTRLDRSELNRRLNREEPIREELAG